jgi:hypothetical protein
MIEPSTYDGGTDCFPQFEDREGMWRDLAVSVGTPATGALAEFLTILSGIYVNGAVVHRCFEIGEHPVFQWYWSRNRLSDMFFFDRFMAQPVVAEALCLESVDDDLNSKFEWLSPLLMPGYMAWALDSGGAYERPKMKAMQMRDLANAAVDQMVGGRYENALFFHSNTPWAEFFMDVAWDHTWILTQLEERRVHVILATDTD